jgi:hypothetical protein
LSSSHFDPKPVSISDGAAASPDAAGRAGAKIARTNPNFMNESKGRDCGGADGE